MNKIVKKGRSRSLSFSIVVETENLGMAGMEDLEASLESLKEQTFPIEKAKEVLIIVGGHVSTAAQSKLKKKFSWLKIHKEKEYLEYTKAKIRGAEVATGEIVIFADSDVRYENTWLENLLKVFTTHPDADIAAGNTRAEIVSDYSMAMNLMWMFHIVPKIEKPTRSYYFSLNNFAIKRKLILKVPFPKDLPLYRANVTFWREKLLKNGAKIYRAPGTRAYHAVPSTVIDWWYRMLIYGADFVAKADFTMKNDGEIVEKRSIIKRVGRLILWSGWEIEQILLRSYKLVMQDIKNIQYLPIGIPIALFNVGITIVGGMIACVNRDYILKKISSLESRHVV